MDYIDAIEKHGEDNVLFMVPMRPIRTLCFIAYTTSSDEPVTVPAKIENLAYENKVTLKSVYEGFGKKRFYKQDLCEMIKSGVVEYYVKCS